MTAPSRYNVLVPLRNGRALAHNSLSGATAVLEAAEHDALLRAGTVQECGDDGVMKTLLYGGFLIQDGIDELAAVEAEYNRQRYDPSGIMLTIAPTLACNFGCDYCFQGTHKPRGHMEIDVQNAVVELVERLAPKSKRLHITWYGGEPLLAHEKVIEPLSDRLLRICDTGGLTYGAMIVTNGYRLTPEIAESLHNRQVKLAQVTLDGAAESHDRRRVLLSGKGTFQRILENLKCVVDRVPLQISVRVNIDSRNSEGIPSLLEALSKAGLGRRRNFSVYFAPVEAITEGCHVVASSCMSKNGYAALETSLHRLAFDLGLAQLPYPGRFRGLCGALRPRALVVLPNGDLHKCWDTVSMPHMRVGSIFHVEQVEGNERARTWKEWSPFQNSSCRTCKLLPSCAGSCAHKFINPEQTLGEAGALPCPSWKYQLKERLVMLAEQAGTIAAKDYDPAQIKTNPEEICTEPPPRRLLMRLTVQGAA